MNKIVSIIVLCIGLAACDTPPPAQLAEPPVAEAPAQPVAVPEPVPAEPTTGFKLLTVEQGQEIAADDPRIEQVDQLLVAVGDRYGLDPERVADMALVIVREIRKTHPDESIIDVLDAPLVATQGDDPVVGDLPTALALYGTARQTGSTPQTAKRVAYSLLHLGSGEADG